VLLRAVAEAVVYFSLATLVAGLVIWLGRLAMPGRVTVSALIYGGALAVFGWRGVRPLAGRVRLFDIARQLEAAAGGRLGERVMSAVELAEGQPPGTSLWMTRRTISLAAREISGLDPGQLVDTQPVKRATLDALVAAAVLAGAFAFKAPYLRLALNPFAAPVAVGAARIEVFPGACRVRLGEPLEVAATAEPLPAQATLEIHWLDGLREEVTMTRSVATNRFTQRINAVTQAFRYRVRAGEIVSPEYPVAIEGPPRLQSVQLQITPPAYTGRPTREVHAGDADVLAGSRVLIVARLAGDPAEGVELRPDGAPAQAMLLETNLAWIELSPKANLTYGLRLVGANGLVADPSERWTLRVLPDEPPTIVLAGQGLEGKAVGPEEALLLAATAHDDVGLRDLALILSVNGTNAQRQLLSWQSRPIAEDASSQVAETTVSLNLAQRDLEAGDELTLWAEATDLGGQVGKSEPLALSILKPENAEAAQLAARLREHLGEADRVQAAFRQTRAQWLAWVRNYGMDPTQTAAQGRLLQQQLGQLRDDLATLATNLFAESGSTKLPIAPYLVGLAGSVSAWGGAQHRILSAVVGKFAAASPGQREEAAARGRDLFDHAAGELAALRARVALAPVALEADAMVARTDLAQGRYKRSLPVVRASLGWDANQQIGLLASFFAGRELNGAPVLQKVDRPSFDNFEVPKVGRENWSARFQGELNVPESGAWNIVCRADDGVRLFLDGSSILPAGAWGVQSAKEHKAAVELAAGWHTISLEFFQASGPNLLQLRLGQPGTEPLEVVSTNLRARLPPSAAPTPNLAELTPAALQAATNRLWLSFAAAARVGAELVSLTNDVPNRDLIRLVEKKSPLGPSILTNLARFREWNSLDAAWTETQADELAAAAREARRIVHEQLNQGRAQWRGAPELQVLRLPVEELRAAANEMRPQAWENQNRQELLARKPAALAAASAWAEELQRATREVEEKFFADARAAGRSLAERAAAVKASLQLEREVMPAAGQIERVLDTAPTVSELVGKTDKELDRIEAALGDLLQADEAAQTAQIARLAAAGLRELRARNRPAVADGVKQIARAERRAGEFTRAEALEQAAAQADARGLNQQLRDRARRERDRPASLAPLIPPPMHDGVKTLEESPDQQVETADRLARPRVALALEAERLRREAAQKTAVAYGQLGRELGQLLQAPDRLSAATLRPLADRASALAGLSGDPAHQAEVNAAWERAQQLAQQSQARGSAESLAARLDEVAGEAQAAADGRSQRPELMEDLDALASPPPPASAEQELAAEAATEARSGIQTAPDQRESYQEAARTLSDAAGELRLGQAGKEAAAAQQAAAAQRAAGHQPGAGRDPGGMARQPQAGDFTRPTGAADGLDQPLSGAEQAEWARLRDKLREGLRSSSIEYFAEEQQEAIRAYFQRLGAEK
jgi:hypothetical protein